MEFGVIETYTNGMVFLPSQGRTLTHASILVESFCRSYVAYIVMELGSTCENPLYAKWVHYNYSLMETLLMPIEAL